MIGVRTANGAYADAVAELPRSTRRTDEVSGSIAVIGGSPGWAGRVLRAVEQGAAGVAVVKPTSVADADLSDAAARVPIVVQRVLLRADSVADATAGAPAGPPRFVQIECSAARNDFEAVLRDGIGWARTLAARPLVLLAARATPRALMVQLEGDGVPVTVLLARRQAAAAWMRALAVDSTRTEVTVAGSTGSPVIVRTDAGGRFQPAARFETAERLILRRLLDALERDDRPVDLQEWRHDSQLAVQALAASRAE